MEIGSGKEGCFKSQQGDARSGYKGRKENEGSDFSSLNRNVLLSCTKFRIVYHVTQDEFI